MSGLVYLFQVNIYLLAFYVFYRLLLSKETFFNLNRFYLIGSTLASFIIPVFQADWIKNLLATQKVQEVAFSINTQAYEVLFQPKAEIETLSLGELIIWAYFAVAGLLLVKFIYQIYQAIKAFEKKQALKACSFFGYMAVDEDLKGKEAIINHELVHVKQYHSADVLFFELAAIINWFNPLAVFYKNEIKKIHEFIADERAAGKDEEKSAYAMLLINQTFGINTYPLTNHFYNQSLTKKRIIMLQKTKSKWVALLKYGLTAPLFLAMLILSSAFVSEKTQGTTQELLETKVLTDTINVPPPPPFAPGKNPLYFVDGKLIEAKAFNKIDPKTIESMNVLDAKQAKKKYGKKGTNGAIEISLLKIAAVSPTKNTPLYILDGKVMDADIQSLNPEEIGSINVLKGEKAAEKYGDKGANGVVEITSKNSLTMYPPPTIEKSSLYIVDGKEMDKAETQKIDPKNIESVNILKDKSATEKYGEKGGNGVVEITTKKGTGISKKEAIKGEMPADTKAMDQIDVLPQFTGGQAAWAKYLQGNLKYPAAARTANITGRVIISFVVEKSGELSEIKVLKGIGSGCDEEAVRVLKESPKWIPGMKDGKPVRVSFTMPINFALAAKTKSN